LEEMTQDEQQSALLKLHRQFAHPPKKCLVVLLKDVGGWREEYDEFSSDEMCEITSILNVRLCTAAGMSPFQNGLCERVHAITDMMLIKLAAENKNVEIETLLSWANMARNSWQMWNGCLVKIRICRI
jgi:hypothetical protein